MAGNEVAVVSETRLKVGRPCTVCDHPQRREIEVALVTGGVLREISSRFGPTRQALVRHRDAHVPSAAQREGAQAVAEAEGLDGASLMDRARGLLTEAQELLAKAKADGDVATALRGVAVANQVLITMSKLTGAIDDGVRLNVMVSPALLELQQAVMRGLSNFPEARQSVMRELAMIAGNGAPMIEGTAG